VGSIWISAEIPTKSHGLAVPLEKEMKMSAINEGALQQRSLGPDRKPHRTLPTSPPLASGNRGMFSGAIIEEDAQSRGKRAAQAGVAFAIQAAIVSALVIVPLFVTEAIDLHQFEKTLLVAPPAAPSPPAIRAQAVVPKQTFLHPLLTAPTIIPKKIVESASDIGAAAPSISDTAGGVAGGTGDVLGGSLGAPPPPPPAAVKPKGPIRISTGMKEPRVLFAPQPVYSPIAKAAHVEGTVILDAIIDEQGDVTQVRVISGPALLLASALKAVSERKYAPTILDGQPVSIRLNVTIDFHLS
jgi:protein TonB